MAILDSLSDSVIYHYHLHAPTGSVFTSELCEWTQKYHDSKHDSAMHRVAYQACAELLIRSLTTVLPIDKVINNICCKASYQYYDFFYLTLIIT